MKTITFDETQWQLVPKEPTREMLRQGNYYAADPATTPTLYRAMLAAAPQPEEREAEHDSKDRRCECCGYMTYHREHLGCIRAAARAHQSPPAKADHWQQYAKPDETAQQCIERHRAEQDALMTLLAQARAEQAAKAAPSCALRLKLGGR